MAMCTGPTVTSIEPFDPALVAMQGIDDAQALIEVPPLRRGLNA